MKKYKYSLLLLLLFYPFAAQCTETINVQISGIDFTLPAIDNYKQVTGQKLDFLCKIMGTDRRRIAAFYLPNPTRKDQTTITVEALDTDSAPSLSIHNFSMTKEMIKDRVLNNSNYNMLKKNLIMSGADESKKITVEIKQCQPITERVFTAYIYEEFTTAETSQIQKQVRIISSILIKGKVFSITLRNMGELEAAKRLATSFIGQIMELNPAEKELTENEKESRSELTDSILSGGFTTYTCIDSPSNHGLDFTLSYPSKMSITAVPAESNAICRFNMQKEDDDDLLVPFFFLEVIEFPQHPLVETSMNRNEISQIYADAIFKIDDKYFLGNNNGDVSRKQLSINGHPACLIECSYIGNEVLLDIPISFSRYYIFAEDKALMLNYPNMLDSNPKYRHKYESLLPALPQIAESIKIVKK